MKRIRILVGKGFLSSYPHTTSEVDNYVVPFIGNALSIVRDPTKFSHLSGSILFGVFAYRKEEAAYPLNL